MPASKTVAARVFAGSIGVTAVVCAFASMPTMISAVGIAGLAGALGGAALGFVHALLAKARHERRTAFWLFVGIVLGLLLASRLGAFTKIRGSHAGLAMLTIAGTLVGGLAFGTSLAVIQPGDDGRSPILARIGPWRWAIAASFVAAALASGLYEATAGWLRSYPVAQGALIGASWTTMSAAALCAVELQRSTRTTSSLRVLWAVVVAFAAIRAGYAPAREMAGLSASDESAYALRVSWWVTDWDRDGYSAFFEGGDCAPFDRAVNPRAREIAGNGIDDNCIFGDARLRLVAAVEPARYPRPPAALNVVLITIDAVRADRTTPYGSRRNTTPNLANLARVSVRYDNAFTSGGWTCLALPSLLSGVYPRRLPWQPMAYTVKKALLPLPYEPRLAAGDAFEIMLTMPRDAQRWTLPAALQRRGLRTAAVINPSGPLRSMLPFLGRGWDIAEVAGADDDRAVTDKALTRLGELRSSPYFLWVHYFDPHEPQTTHEGVAAYGETLEDRYDHELSSTDHEVARLVSAVDADVARPTAIIVAADHGEAFENGFQFHGTDLGGDLLKIPLLVRAPGLAPSVVRTPASLVDIAPTILALTDTPLPAGLDGRDLRSISGDRAVVTDLFRVDPNSHVFLDSIAVSGSAYRLTYDRLKRRRALTHVADMSRSPRELDLGLTPKLLADVLGGYIETIDGEF